MVPMQMSSERPFQRLISKFLTNRQGITYFSWDLRDGPFTVTLQLNDDSALNPAWMLPTTASSAFKFSSALGYLDIAYITVPRSPRLWQPRGSGDDYDRVSRLEGQLLLYGGAHREAIQDTAESRRRYIQQNRARTVSRSRYIHEISMSTSQSARTLAAQQNDYNHLEDDDLQHLK